MVLSLALQHGSSWKRRPLYREARTNGLLLGVPLDYMNRTGPSVAALLRDSGVPVERLLVVCDDVNLPLGRLRLRRGGGDGGHKGLRSIIAVVGTEEFARLRMGVGKPPPAEPLDQYVLDRFARAEESAANTMVERAAEAVVCWHREGIEVAMARFNSSVEEGAA